MWTKAVERLRDAVTDAAWRQWRAIGAPATDGGRAHTLVDPEALLLLSLYLEDRERRLSRFVAWWAESGATLLSVQRTRNLLRTYHTAELKDRVAAFALLAWKKGNDARWRSLAGKALYPGARHKDSRAAPKVTDPAALMLRLRVGIGVGIKADLLAFLLGQHGSRETVKDIAAATYYNSRAVRRAVDEMASARLVRSWGTAPATYSADVDAWSALLALGKGRPVWRHWHPVYCFTAGLLDWSSATATVQATPYLQSSRARDLVRQHTNAFELTGILLPAETDYVGEAYLEPFGQAIERMAAWVGERSEE